MEKYMKRFLTHLRLFSCIFNGYFPLFAVTFWTRPSVFHEAFKVLVFLLDFYLKQKSNQRKCAGSCCDNADCGSARLFVVFKCTEMESSRAIKTLPRQKC